MIKIFDLDETSDDVNILVEMGREDFRIGFQHRVDGKQGRQTVGDSDNQGATLSLDQKLRDVVGITKAHSFVHAGPEKCVAVDSGDTAMINEGFHFGANIRGR
jgi:hypothetical protein